MSRPHTSPASTHDTWWWSQASGHPAASHAFTSRGARLHYRRWSGRRGPTLAFVHGFRGHTHWWDWIAPSFARDFDVVALDLSGMGDSDWRPCYEPDTFALDILGLVEHLGQPATVVGHSFGGNSLLRACALDSTAAGAPSIRHAIVLDTWVRLPGHPPPPAGPLGGTRAYTDFETARSRFRLEPPQGVADAAMLDHLARHSVRQVDDGWRWKFDPALPPPPARRDIQEMLRSIGAAVDIVYGESSAVVSRERAAACVAELAHGRGPIAIPNAQHHLMFDQPVALVATLRALLATVPSGSGEV